jgi:hypothetical protein
VVQYLSIDVLSRAYRDLFFGLFAAPVDGAHEIVNLVLDPLNCCSDGPLTVMAHSDPLERFQLCAKLGQLV